MTKKLIVPDESPELLHADVEAAADATALGRRDTDEDEGDEAGESMLIDPQFAFDFGLIAELNEIPGG